MIVGILVDKLKIKNNTNIQTLNYIVPDNWMYIQEKDVRLCRLTIFNNWSPYLIKDKNKVWLGLEYMCDVSDDIWQMSDQEFINFSISELVKLKFIDKDSVLDSCRIKMEKAYPAYFGSYKNFDQVKAYLDKISNLYCVGRNGQHKYNNQDHSMLTAIEAVECIINNKKDKTQLWSINTEQTYHEKKL